MRNIVFSIHIKSSQGFPLARIDDFLSLLCLRRVNQPGLLEFRLPASHPAVRSLEDRGIVELWWKNPGLGLPWTCEARGLYLAQEQQERDSSIFTARCPGPLWLLSTRIIAYPPLVEGRSLYSGPSGSTARQLVYFNAASGATTANGRLRNGGVNGIQVEPDTGGGPVLDWECSFENLLDSLQELARSSGSDFDLLYRAPKGWLFTWYNGISGIDRTASAIFDTRLGNMSDSSYALDSRRAKNAVIASGFDAAGDPIYNVQEGYWSVQEGDDYPEGRTSERYLHAPNCRTGAELAARADALLSGSGLLERVKFKVRQLDTIYYGRDYFLGDLVTVRCSGLTLHKQVREVKIASLSGGNQEITVELS